MSFEEKNNSSGEDKMLAVRRHALKLTEALYRTTELMFDGEPLKWSLRQSALEVLNLISSLSRGGQSNKTRELKRLADLAESLFLNLELASAGSYVSRSNFEVLHREYSRLKSIISENCNSPAGEAGKPLDLSLSDNILLDTPNKSEKDNVRYDSMPDKNTFLTVGEVLERKEAPIASGSNGGNGRRKEVLLSALQKNGPSSVGELVKVFEGEISEKTVQRELNSMVAEGAAKMAGDKRWRRYFLPR